ncbi:zinc ABC transporter substrate-binding protein ZnuA [Lonepinella sp. BR2357]|uniref:zinc ABC transporter substrate-binding protein ZnuA n=1 Tax=Lonepinella sp. BR2357 TaxID=3434549 RepID=UPI003F6E2C7C
MSKLTKTAIASAILAAAFSAQADIVTSVKPLGFIASSIADGVLDTQIIVPAGASPHDYNLKPTDIQKIKSADLVLWIGKDVDSFLTKPIAQADSKKVVTIADIEGVTALLEKSAHHHHHDDGDDDDHDHDHDDHDHDHADHDHDHDGHHHEVDENGLTVNWHIWYSPKISQLVANQLAEKLTAQFPAKKALIAENLANFNRTLQEKNSEITQQLSAFKDKGFFVFHDAYGYFNSAYGLNQTGAFTINPLVAPGAKTIAHIKEEIEEHKVNCLFAEPQFTPKVINSLAKSTGVKVGRLDPMGDSVKLGKNAYSQFLQFTADSYASCLK